MLTCDNYNAMSLVRGVEEEGSLEDCQESCALTKMCQILLLTPWSQWSILLVK